MLEYGQPIHAFDINTLAGGKVVIRTANEGDKFTTLDETERTLSEGMLMICDAKKPAEKINSRAYSLWQNINSTNKEIEGSKSILDIYDKSNKKIETITRGIVDALKTNRDIFGFKIKRHVAMVVPKNIFAANCTTVST